MKDVGGTLRKVFWESGAEPGKGHIGAYVFFTLALCAFVVEMAVHHKGAGFLGSLGAETVSVFYNTDPVTVSDIGSSGIARLLLIAAMFRIGFGIVIGSLDILLHERIKGEPFDWSGMITIASVNSIYLLTAIFTLANPLFLSVIDRYVAVVRGVPTVIELSGPLALLVTCLLADFCYYWSHRWSHKIRMFWCLGHVSHHRTQNLTQMTQAVDPQSAVLDVAGGRAFVLLLMPIVTKLFSLDVTQSGWALIVILLFDAWTNPSHSITLYQAEIRFGFLRAARAILVTPGVHYVHHSREKGHNKDFGCNFGARLTIWDRLFGTYVEPPPRIPKTGLFGETDYIRNPIRYVFHPFRRMFLELRLNKLRYWPYILFAKTTYQPPVRVKSRY